MRLLKRKTKITIDEAELVVPGDKGIPSFSYPNEVIESIRQLIFEVKPKRRAAEIAFNDGCTTAGRSELPLSGSGCNDCT
jgi:hypothetical protein